MMIRNPFYDLEKHLADKKEVAIICERLGHHMLTSSGKYMVFPKAIHLEDKDRITAECYVDEYVDVVKVNNTSVRIYVTGDKLPSDMLWYVISNN
jgi:hypothetical protein